MPAMSAPSPVQDGRAGRRAGADIAQAETLNVGKPLFQAEDDVQTVDCFRYHAGGQTAAGRYPGRAGGLLQLHPAQPIGVCVGIVPWNFPFQITA
jgi:acyl-CoA reductase-like NAD-dependent aldehyde dehydrogenase